MVDEMNRLRWEIIKASELSIEYKTFIAQIKNEHWPYGVNSQIKWMDEHIRVDDFHYMGIDKSGMLRAYLTLVHILIDIGNSKEKAFGVGGVCVGKSIEHSGYGREMMSVVNKYIQEENKYGVLLCKDRLIDFYSKCNWQKIDYEVAFVEGKPYYYNIMGFPCYRKSNTIIIDRNF